jgi:ATP-dependent RNA helicase DeaD
MNFDAMGLRTDLVRAVAKLGFHAPMPIQEQAIPLLLAGEKDFVGLAQTGTGKTAAFGLPLIHRIDPALRRPQAIVMCPTRELCLQITADLKALAFYEPHIGIAAVYGGASISEQVRRLRTGVHIIVATPGRLLDLINRKVVSLAQVTHAVLDEADEMLNMGFQEDIDRILADMTDRRRIWLFSATMPSGVAAIARRYLIDPVRISVGGRNASAANIDHTCCVIREKDRYQGLKRIIDYTPEIRALVFCRTRSEARSVTEALVRDGYQADTLHGDLAQAQRDHVMQKFRQASLRILVATDVAARGLDVQDITHVIHYTLPVEVQIYTHRSGRTARAGKSGSSIVLINEREKGRIRELEKRCHVRFGFGKIPDGRSICAKQLAVLVDKIVQAEVDQGEIGDFLPAVHDALAGLDREELIRRLVSAEFKRVLRHYRNADDINVIAAPATVPTAAKEKKRDHRTAKRTQRFLIDIGRLDKINAGAIVRLICHKSGIRSDMIGTIDLNRDFSYFEVEESAARHVWNSVNNATLDGRLVQVRKVTAKKQYAKRQQRMS